MEGFVKMSIVLSSFSFRVVLVLGVGIEERERDVAIRWGPTMAGHADIRGLEPQDTDATRSCLRLQTRVRR